MNTFKKSDLVYLNRPDSEWILKIDTADNQRQVFTFADAVVRIKPPHEIQKDIEDIDDLQDQDYDDFKITDDDFNTDDPIALMDDTEDNFLSKMYEWKPLIETIHPDYPIRRDYFPYDFVTSYADAVQFDLYMDLIGDWNSSFYQNVLARRRNTPRKQTTPR
jgi:hypothetical protein